MNNRTDINFPNTDKKFSVYQLLNDIEHYDTDVIYLGGSLIDGVTGKYSNGIGNELSDLDVFIIRDTKQYTDTNAVYNNSTKKNYFISSQNIACDIEIFNINSVKDLLNTISNMNFDVNTRVPNILPQSEGWDSLTINTFLTRSKNSICIHNKKKFNEIFNDSIYSKYISYRKLLLLNLIDNTFDDIWGNIERENLITSLFLTREQFQKFMNYILLCYNELVDRDKWTITKFMNLCKVNKLDKYEEIVQKLYLEDVTSLIKMKEVIILAAEFIENAIADVTLRID